MTHTPIDHVARARGHPATSAPNGRAILKGAGLVMPWCDTERRTSSRSVPPRMIVDQAGWHLTPKLAIPDNITVLALPPSSTSS